VVRAAKRGGRHKKQIPWILLYIRIDWPDHWNNYLAFWKGHELFESNPIINSHGFRDLKRDNSSIDCKEIYSKRKILLEAR
jgi:hypothetical protein